MPTARTMTARSFPVRAYVFSETVNPDTIGAPVLIPADAIPGQDARVEISPAPGARAVIEHTLSGVAAVNAGTAIWTAWGQGVVEAADHDYLTAKPTALRCVSENGAAFWRVTLPR